MFLYALKVHKQIQEIEGHPDAVEQVGILRRMKVKLCRRTWSRKDTNWHKLWNLWKSQPSEHRGEPRETADRTPCLRDLCTDKR